MDFILATNNMKKLAEMQRILSPLGINVVTAKMLGITLPEVVEDGDTFEANAKIKAESACKITGLPAIADDSGLCVDYLNGAPGIYSARYSGEHGNDALNRKKLLEEENKEKDKWTSLFEESYVIELEASFEERLKRNKIYIT